MKTISRLVLVGIIGFVVSVVVSCSNEKTPSGPSAVQSGCGNVQGNGNSVNCGASATPTPVASTDCVQSIAAFTCGKATPQFEAILSAVQAKVADAPEAIYVPALVKALNAHLGADNKPDICATSGFPLSTDEVAIKARVSNAVSETWDVVNANGSKQSLYVSTCSPSRF